MNKFSRVWISFWLVIWIEREWKRKISHLLCRNNSQCVSTITCSFSWVIDWHSLEVFVCRSVQKIKFRYKAGGSNVVREILGQAGSERRTQDLLPRTYALSEDLKISHKYAGSEICAQATAPPCSSVQKLPYPYGSFFTSLFSGRLCLGTATSVFMWARTRNLIPLIPVRYQCILSAIPTLPLWL